jgi:hypothetical protein
MIERAVYSLWTSPMDDEHVGFNSEEALFNCFRLSLHHTKKWFKRVHLITDLKGRDLVKKYDLNFDKVSVDLEDAMWGIDKKHWALGKIYACKIQDVPFIHLDIDVILFKKLPDSLFSKDAIFQNSENKLERYSFYKDMMILDKKMYKNRPDWYDVNNLHALNCGLIGFNRLDFLEEWWIESLKYIEYLRVSDDSDGGYKTLISSLIFEQQFVGCLCKNYGYSISKLTDLDPKSSKIEWVSEGLSKFLGYTHLISASKRDSKVEDKVKGKLKLLDLPFN